MLHTLHFPLQNAVYFIMLTFLIPVLFTFYIQGGPLLPFEGILSVLMSLGQVTGPSQWSSGGAATLMPLELHAFL